MVPLLILAVCAALLSLFTVSEQYQHLFDAGRMQLERHIEVLRNEALDPWQYRLLSAYSLEGYLLAARELGWSRDPVRAMLVFRVLQNFLLFLVAGLFFRALRMSPYLILIGLSILAWGMSQAHYESDLSFNLYFDVLFYLAAGLIIGWKKDSWLIPLAVVAVLNRETSLLMPFLLLAARMERRPKIRIQRRVILITAAAFLLQVAAYALVRWQLGPKEPFYPHEVPWGLALLRYNLSRQVTLEFLMATFGIVPILALFLFRDWPPVLRRYFWILVPIWLTLHSFLGVLAETRILLVPYALVLLPGALLGVQARLQRGSHPT